MDYIAYNVPQGETHPNISGIDQLRYAENTYFASVPDINTISLATINKYNMSICPEQVIRGLEFFIATKDSAKLYKGYSSGQSEEFFDEDFDTVRGIRIKRPMSEDEVTDRYEAIRWLRIRMVKNHFKKKFENLTINKTPQERATWKIQEEEANAYLNDNTVSTPTLSLLATAKNTTVELLAPIVISAVNSYNTQVTQLFVEEETYVNELKIAEGDDIINVEIPVQRTIIPGDTRFDAIAPPSGE
jgi:hypothetical protein